MSLKQELAQLHNIKARLDSERAGRPSRPVAVPEPVPMRVKVVPELEPVPEAPVLKWWERTLKRLGL